MTAQTKSEKQIHILRETIVEMVRSDSVDLTARQLAIFLTCYLNDDDQTVRGLAGELNISKPAISRSLDRLTGLNLVTRKPDPSDKRSVLVERTSDGVTLLAVLKSITENIKPTNRKSSS